MRISSVRTRVDGDQVRAETDVVWEDSDRSALLLFFEIRRPGGPPSIDANAFVAAAAVPAFRHGERRIAIDGTVCPRLRDGIAAAIRLLGAWHGARSATLRIEPTGGFHAPRPASAPRAAVFVSGGIDSLYSVWWNRRFIPRGHPRSFREAIRILDLMYPVDSSPERRAHIELRSRRSVAAIARAAGLDVAEAATNATRLEEDLEAFCTWTHGSVLAACGVAGGSVLSDVTISASHDVRTAIKPWGSHPLLDPLFGTAAIDVRHAGIEARRLDKTTAIAGWKEALESLYVCEAGPFEGDSINCGRCEKCVRTRVALLVGPGIADPPTFPPGRLTADDVEGMPHLANFRRLSYFWTALAPAARSAGRPDLAEAIDRMIARQRDIEAWAAGSGWKGALRRLDERHFGSALLRVRRRWRPR